jgi:putative ABC transport system permease protein
MTLFGIIGCTVLLVGGLGMKDTMDAFIETFYNQAIRYENRINLDTASVTNEEAAETADACQGDWGALSSVQVEGAPVSLEVYHIERDLVRFPAEAGGMAEPGDDGAWVCARIAKKLALKPGNSLSFYPYGEEKEYTVRVAGVIRSMTESIVMTDGYAEKIGYDYRINTIFTREKEIPTGKAVLNAQSRQAIMDSFDTFMQLMNVMVFLLVTAAVVLGIVVLYNLGVMSYTERYREMATPKVLGFKDRRSGRLLVSQNLWLTVLGSLIGLPAGWGILRYLLDALAGEYELQLVIGPVTYLISILLTTGVSLLVGLMVSRKNRHIDMVAALKTEE